MITYAHALARLAPGAAWKCDGSQTEYSNFTWLDDSPMPTKTACDAIMAELEAEVMLNGLKQARQVAYQAEADPLYFGWQRGENTEQAWLDKVAEIRGRYPYPA
jgi:hypothetical protein